jgi:hypothetical protein
MKSKKSQEKVCIKKRISVQAAKSKGRRLQQWTAKQISELLGIPCGKDEEICSREMGQSGTDVRLSRSVKKLFPYSIETKCQERFNVVSAIEQAKANQEEGTEWLLIFSKNRFDKIACMDATHFFSLLKRIKNLEDSKKKAK